MSLTADERFSIIPEWLLRSGVSDRAIRLYAELGTFADYTTGIAVPGRKTLAARMRCSVDTVDRLKAELIEANALTVRKRKLEGAPGNDTNEYVIHRIPIHGRTGAATWPQDPGRTGAARTREPSNEKLSPSEREAVSIVRAAWESSEVLISHRPTYFTASATVTAIKKAFKVYPAEVVAEAIGNYATVLGGVEYRWSYKWTLVDFLGRGLDKFVPEADPLRNFRDAKRAKVLEEGARSYDL